MHTEVSAMCEALHAYRKSQLAAGPAVWARRVSKPIEVSKPCRGLQPMKEGVSDETGIPLQDGTIMHLDQADEAGTGLLLFVEFQQGSGPKKGRAVLLHPRQVLADQAACLFRLPPTQAKIGTRRQGQRNDMLRLLTTFDCFETILQHCRCWQERLPLLLERQSTCLLA